MRRNHPLIPFVHHIWIPLIFLTFMQVTCSNKVNTTTPGTVEASTIIKDLSKGKSVILEDQTIEGTLDFTELESYPSHPTVYIADISSRVVFMNCTFNGEVVGHRQGDDVQIATHFLHGLTFMNCTFNEDVNFKYTTVDGMAIFSNSYFVKNLNLEGATFRSDFVFDKGVVGKDTRLQNTTFWQNANFMNASFGEVAYFQGTTFRGDAQFGVAEFHGYADMTQIRYEKGCFFNYAKFHDQAIFNNAHAKDRTEFMYVLFEKNTEFRRVVFSGQTRFNEAKFEDKINFSDSRFVLGKPELDQISLASNDNLILENTVFHNYENLSDTEFKNK